MKLHRSGRISPKRILIDIDEIDHRKIKMRSAKLKMTMKEFVITAIAALMKHTEKQDVITE